MCRFYFRSPRTTESCIWKCVGIDVKKKCIYFVFCDTAVNDEWSSLHRLWKCVCGFDCDFIWVLFDAKIIEISLLFHSWLQTPGLTWVNRCLTVMVKHRSGLWTCRPKVFWTSSWSAPSSELWQNDHPTPLSAPLLLNACVKDDLRRTVARATLTNSGWWTLSSR